MRWLQLLHWLPSAKRLHRTQDMHACPYAHICKRNMHVNRSAHTTIRSLTHPHLAHLWHDDGHGVGLVEAVEISLCNELTARKNVLEGCGHDIPAGVIAGTVARAGWVRDGLGLG